MEDRKLPRVNFFFIGNSASERLYHNWWWWSRRKSCYSGTHFSPSTKSIYTLLTIIKPVYKHTGMCMYINNIIGTHTYRIVVFVRSLISYYRLNAVIGTNQKIMQSTYNEINTSKSYSVGYQCMSTKNTKTWNDHIKMLLLRNFLQRCTPHDTI